MKTTLNEIREHRPCGCGCGQQAPKIMRTNAAKGHVKGEPHKFVSGHNVRLLSSLESMMKSVVKKSVGECWNWPGRLNKKGYGEIQVRGVKHLAHRAIYLAHGLSIPDGLHLDHLCRNKTCVNPAHLEPVTNSENVRRQHASRRLENAA